MKEINRASLVTEFSHSNQSKQIYVPHVSQSHASLNPCSNFLFKEIARDMIGVSCFPAGQQIYTDVLCQHILFPP